MEPAGRRRQRAPGRLAVSARRCSCYFTSGPARHSFGNRSGTSHLLHAPMAHPSETRTSTVQILPMHASTFRLAEKNDEPVLAQLRSGRFGLFMASRTLKNEPAFVFGRAGLPKDLCRHLMGSTLTLVNATAARIALRDRTRCMTQADALSVRFREVQL